MASLFDLEGRVALVTGGSRGLGFEMARALGHAGAAVVITARKPEPLAEAARRLEGEGIAVAAHAQDATDLETAGALVERVMQRHGRIDILVNNAGATWGAPAAEHPLEAWRKVMAVNLDGVFALTQAVARDAMLPAARGSIVIVASIAGLGGAPAGRMATVAYNTSKAGAINLARSLACEWGPQGVRVNALLPGWFPTRMSAGLLEREGDAFLARIPLGRFGEPARDIAGPILFLASDASAYVNGAVLAVDGGLSALV